jgi:hypothetical protein
MEEEGEEINPSKWKIPKEDAWMDNDEREILATTEVCGRVGTGHNNMVVCLTRYKNSAWK